jgi:hypothetical protein
MLNVVYDCRIPEVMGYPERGYCFCRGGDALLMWSGYFSDLMYGMWALYGWESDPDDPDHPCLDQVPLLREWSEHWIGTHGPLPIAELPTTARAFRDAMTELQRAGPNHAESLEHGEALAAFLEQAVADGLPVSVEEWWG